MYKSTAANVLTVFGAVILTIVLVFASFATLSVSVVTSVLSPSAIIESVFSDEDTVDDFVDEFVNDLEMEDVDSEFVEEILESDIFKDAVSDVSEELSENLFKDSDQKIIDEKFLRKFIKKNAEEIADIYCDNVDTDMSRAEIEEEIVSEANKIAEEFADEMPTTGEIFEEVDSEVLALLEFVFGGGLMITLIIVTVVIAALLYLLRFKYLGGLKWIGSAGIFSAGLLAIVALIFNIAVAEVEDDAPKAVMSMFDSVHSAYTTTAIVTLVVSIVLIVVGCVVGRFLKNRKAVTPAPAYAAPVEPAAPVVEEPVVNAAPQENACDYDIGAMNRGDNSDDSSATDNAEDNVNE